MRLKLRVVSGLQIGDHKRIDPPGGFIGRSESCALHLRDDSVSRSHVELRFQQDDWWAYQRSARSATVVDGVPVGSQPLSLRESGLLQVGGVTIEYAQERASAEPLGGLAEHESPPTMINVRRQLPTIQQAVLPQMTPLRAPEPPQAQAPPTLILRRQSEPAPLDAPPTLIRRPPAPPPAELGESSPPTLIRRPEPATAPRPPEPTLTSASAIEALPELALAEDLVKVEKERDELRKERNQLTVEVRRLSEENLALRALQTAEQPRAPATAALSVQALRLLMPFTEALEQTTEALQGGDVVRARTLLREASFGLADLRDLFESNDR